MLLFSKKCGKNLHFSYFIFHLCQMSSPAKQGLFDLAGVAMFWNFSFNLYSFLEQRVLYRKARGLSLAPKQERLRAFLPYR